jgi:putative flippase GtrA
MLVNLSMPLSTTYSPLTNHHIRQFSRYTLAGILMLIANLLLVWFFTRFFGFHYLFSCAVAFIVESFIGFSVNKRWTFKSQIHFKKGYFRFLIIALYSLIAILFITYGLITYLAFHYIWARTISSVVTGIIGYVLDLKITFRV